MLPHKDSDRLFQKFDQDMANLDVSVVGIGEGVDTTSSQGKQVKLQAARPTPIIENIVPEKWFCLVAKSSIYHDYAENSVEVFINFEWSERIEDPKTELVCAHSGHDHHHAAPTHPTTGSTRDGEHHYRIPYVLDRAYNSKTMKIFDFVVGRKAMRWARKQSDFLNVLVQTVIEALEETFSETIDRTSLAVSSKTDYKLSPEFEATAQTDAVSPSPNGLTPYFERKLASIGSASRLQQANTGLTQAQREMLLERTHPSLQGPFSFIKLYTGPSFCDQLAMSIPASTLLQNERNVTVQLCVPLGATCIQWNVRNFLKPVSGNEKPTEGAGEVASMQLSSSFVPVLTSFFELSFVHNGSNHALYLKMFGKIDSSQSYATLSGEDATFVLRKETVSSWPSILVFPSIDAKPPQKSTLSD